MRGGSTTGEFELYTDAAGKYRYRLKAGNGQIIATGEVYESKVSAMAPLGRDQASRVLEACDQLLRERARIAELAADLSASWTAVRKALNELQAIVG